MTWQRGKALANHIWEQFSGMSLDNSTFVERIPMFVTHSESTLKDATVTVSSAVHKQ
jgi:hypothetical protein